MERVAFDAGNASADSFGELMGRIDGFFELHAVVIYRGVPLTFKQQGWLTISLELYQESLDLAVDPNDGYLSAFREGEGEEDRPWYYMKDCRSDGLDDETRMLAVESGYGDLVNLDWDGVAAGIPALHDSIYRLLRFLRSHRNAAVPDDGVVLNTEEKRALARLIFMMCEPPRLRSARIFVSRAMTSHWLDEVITRELRAKVNGWSKMSRFALHCVQLAIKNKEDEHNKGELGQKELKAVESFGIKSLEDAVGPKGELLLIKSRDYLKEDQDLRSRKNQHV